MCIYKEGGCKKIVFVDYWQQSMHTIAATS